MGIKKGTKLTDTPKDILYQIRVDGETDSKVKAICESKGLSKSEVVRQGIDMLYKATGFKEDLKNDKSGV